jgi:hypothetical protein
VLAIVNINVVVPFNATFAEPNAFVSVGLACTVNPLVVTLLVSRAKPTMFPLVLLYGPPGTLLVTSTDIVQVACALFMDAPATAIDPPPGVAVTAPTPLGQVLEIFGIAATSTFVGKVSVKLIPDCAGFPTPLVSVKLNVDVPPWSIVVGVNALFKLACTTVKV